MITKEIVNGEEFFAVDDESLPPTDPACKRCCLDNSHLCNMARCDAGGRHDKRGVHFRPLSDLRIQAAYAIQEATKGQKNLHEHNTPPG